MNDSTEGSAATSTTADVTMTAIPVTATTNGSTDVLTTAATIVAALEEVSTPETKVSFRGQIGLEGEGAQAMIGNF